MCASPKAATEADAPDADRVGPDAPAPMPDWLLRILVQIVCCLIKAWLALHPRGTHAQRSRPVDRPSPSPVSGQSANDFISTSLDETIARACQEQDVSPEDAARAKMARQITALINRMRSPDSDPSPQPESEPHEVSADTMPRPTPRRRQHHRNHCVTSQALVGAHGNPDQRRHACPCSCAHAANVSPAPAQVRRRDRLLSRTAFSVSLDARGRSTVGPAVLIRASCKRSAGRTFPKLATNAAAAGAASSRTLPPQPVPPDCPAQPPPFADTPHPALLFCRHEPGPAPPASHRR